MLGHRVDVPVVMISSFDDVRRLPGSIFFTVKTVRKW